jgi:ATP-dependent DNA helicase RecG
MQSREQIIQLGKVLAEEQRQGYHNTTVAAGLEQFLQQWRAESNGALRVPAVRKALALLADYGAQPAEVRQQRLDMALSDLRDIFRARRDQQPADADAATPDQGEHADQPDQPAASGEKLKPAPARKPRQRAKAAPVAPAAALTPDTPIKEIPGVGRSSAAFKRLKLHTARDLLYHFPHRYDDYTSQKRIADLQVGAVETVVVKVSDARTFRMKNGREAVEVQVQDESGMLKAVFFGAGWLVKQFTFGRKIVLSGKVTTFQGSKQMQSPDWEPYTEDELLHTGRLVPVHPLTKGLHERNARAIIKQVVDQLAPCIEDHIPPAVRERAGLLPLAEALAQVHFPDSQDVLERARARLAFDELLLIQLGVVQRRLRWQAELGYALEFKEEVHEALLTQLPFELTGAQVRTLEEIFEDIQRPVPMARLLQGDVGSGKTVVAAAALLQVIANGFQAALMAPTEILAEQHYKGLRKLLGGVRVPRETQQAAAAASPDGDWKERLEADELARLDEIKRLLGMTPEDDLEGEGVRVALLTGSLGTKERRRVLEGIEQGEVDLIIGTHALITEDSESGATGVRYHNLGMICIDEQHRFGVEQRERLKRKGFNPHMLVMTATPIPRTLTLTIYGELDTAVLDELPPGRQEIKTRWITRAERRKAYKHMRREIERGRQCFVICPLVEESEKIDLPSAEEMYQSLQQDIFPDLRSGLIHGRMLGREKDEVMRAFRDHQFDILVATSVIEVGIDVPNATTIVIEGAERFGLAQLHQFRGRVGRGAHQSYCILVSDVDNEVTRQRLEAMEATTDGFKLAEKDLELRGPGEFFGRRQSGTPDLKMARLSDTLLLHHARREAQAILASDPELARPEHALLRTRVEAFWRDVEGAS